MTNTHKLTAFCLTLAALLSSQQAAQADPLRDIFRHVTKGKVFIGTGDMTPSPGFGQPGHGHPPGYGLPQPPSFGKPWCKPLPPPPIRRCLYCVYYMDCHGQWHLYRCFHSRWAATSAEQQLQFQGYQTFLRVKHITVGPGGGYPSDPPGMPALDSTPPALFGR